MAFGTVVTTSNGQSGGVRIAKLDGTEPGGTVAGQICELSNPDPSQYPDGTAVNISYVGNTNNPPQYHISSSGTSASGTLLSMGNDIDPAVIDVSDWGGYPPENHSEPLKLRILPNPLNFGQVCTPGSSDNKCKQWYLNNNTEIDLYSTVNCAIIYDSAGEPVAVDFLV